jgi:hypothetical protein
MTLVTYAEILFLVILFFYSCGNPQIHRSLFQVLYYVTNQKENKIKHTAKKRNDGSVKLKVKSRLELYNFFEWKKRGKDRNKDMF